MSALLAKARAGQVVTLLDKIAAETSVEELDGMRMAALTRPEGLSTSEAMAFALRRAELLKGAR